MESINFTNITRVLFITHTNERICNNLHLLCFGLVEKGEHHSDSYEKMKMIIVTFMLNLMI